jgi:hypothetical protein
MAQMPQMPRQQIQPPWIAQQISEALPWDEAPRYFIRDRDTSYGAAVTQRLQAMGIATGRSRHAHHGKTGMSNG